MREMKKLQKTAGGQKEELLRDTYIEVDLDKLAANVVMIKDMVGPEVAITAVIKANGYGHGAWQIAQSIMDAGADYLAVATLTEALELREHAIDAPILIMGHTPDRLLHHVAEQDLTQTIFSLEQAKLLNELAEDCGRKVKAFMN